MKKFLLIITFLLASTNSVFAAIQHDHAPKIFHSFTLEVDAGENRDGAVQKWDLDGWIGNDFDKLFLKSEGEISQNNVEKSEFFALYSKNISEFWDGQIGIRYDEQPNSLSYLTFGFEGLAPYFLETESYLFFSENGNLTARLHQETDLSITQKLILQPYFELNFAAQKVDEEEIGKGFVDGEFGLQTRYEITKKFAPYFDFHYETKFGETAKIAKKHDENRDDFIVALGLRLKF